MDTKLCCSWCGARLHSIDLRCRRRLRHQLRGRLLAETAQSSRSPAPPSQPAEMVRDELGFQSRSAFRDQTCSPLVVPSDGASFLDSLSSAVWLSIEDASGAGFFRALDRRAAAFLGCGAATAVALGATRREAGRFVAFGAETSGAFVERAGLDAVGGAFRAFAVRDDEAALRGAGAALPRADLAFSFSRVAFSLSLRAVSFSRIAASAAFATCDRPASGVASRLSKKALTTLFVPRGAAVSDFAIEFCSPTLAGITLICHDHTIFRCP